MDVRERPATLTARHPWETVRARFFCRLLARTITGPVRVLDLGAGDGYVAAQLVDALPPGSSIVCVDAAYTDGLRAELGESAPPGITFVRETPADSYDAIVMLDVLEHIADDVGFVREVVVPRLADGGRVLASVPALQSLFTQHDVMLGHHRRYSRTQLREALERGGLRVEAAGPLFASLVVPRAAAKLLERVRGPAPASGVGHWEHGRLVTTAVETALAIDAKLCGLAARAAIPGVGLSVWALCGRP